MSNKTTSAPAADAVGSRLDRGVGRPEPERDKAGPRGTYGCACVADSARLCTLLRYGRDIDSREQHDDDCECLCHQWRDDDER